MDSIKSKKEIKVEKKPVGRPLGSKNTVKVEVKVEKEVQKIPEGSVLYKGKLIVFNPDPLNIKEKDLDLQGIPLGTVINLTGSSTEYMIVCRNKVVTLAYGKDFENSSGSYTSSSIIQPIRNKGWIVRNNYEAVKEALKNYTNVVKMDKMSYKKDTPYAVVQIGSNCSVSIGSGVTGNCQLVVIGCMDALLANSTDPFKQIIEIAKFSGNRRMVMCDVKEPYLNKLKEIFKERIVVAAPYESSNGSKMNAVVINLKGLI